MNYATEKNNRVYIMGEIVSDATFSHEVYGEGFYEFLVRVMRLSGQADVLPITVSERLIEDSALSRGSTICALGQFRSYNKLENGKSRLMLTVFVREILREIPGNNPNSIVLSGYICKPPVYRTTPFNREIAVSSSPSTARTTSPITSPASPGGGTRASSEIFPSGKNVAISGAAFRAASIRSGFPKTTSRR